MTRLRALAPLLVTAAALAMTACTSGEPDDAAGAPSPSRSAPSASVPTPSASAVPSSSADLKTTYTQVCIRVPADGGVDTGQLTEDVAAAIRGARGLPSNVVSVQSCSDEVVIPGAATTLRIDFFGDLEADQLSQVTSGAASAVPGAEVRGGDVPGTGVRILIPQRGELDLSAQTDALGSILGTFSSVSDADAAGVDYIGPTLTARQIDEVVGLVAAAGEVDEAAVMLYPWSPGR